MANETRFLYAMHIVLVATFVSYMLICVALTALLSAAFTAIMFVGGNGIAYYFFIFQHLDDEPPEDDPTGQKEHVGAGKLPALVFVYTGWDEQNHSHSAVSHVPSADL